MVALATKAEWEASAPGRVAPLGGEVDVRPEAPGVVTTVYAKVGDVVKKGDLIAGMKDREAFTRVVAAAAEVEVRVSERDEEKESDKLLLAWRKAQDDLGAAERALFKAQTTFDTLFIARRQGKASDRDVENARRLIEVARISIESSARPRVRVGSSSLALLALLCPSSSSSVPIVAVILMWRLIRLPKSRALFLLASLSFPG